MKPLLVRVLSFLIVIGLLWIETQRYALMIFGIGIAHFTISLYLSPKRIRSALSHTPGLYAGLLLAATMALTFYLDMRLSFFVAFSSHLALSETYDAFHEQVADRPLYLFRFLFHMACYLTASFADYPYFSNLSTTGLMLPLFFLLLSYTTGAGKKNIHIGSDLFTFFIVCGIVVYRQELPFIIPLLLAFYHFIYWLIAPVLYRPDKKNLVILGGNIALSLVLTVLLIKMIQFNQVYITSLAFGYTLFAYLHTYHSIPGSLSNPAWVTNFFHPDRRVFSSRA